MVSIFKECFPDKLILADLKTMDAGALEAGYIPNPALPTLRGI